MTKRSAIRILTGLTLLLAAHPVAASDGVVELNDTCAERTGCFPGDSPGYPITITGPGSYRVTGNLTTGSRQVDAISISTSDVTLDLGGFTIACAFGLIQPSACFLAGGGRGVHVLSSSTARRRIKVRNGTIQGMGSDGVLVRVASRVENMIIGGNGGDGIELGTGSIAVRNTVYDNAGFGLLFSGPFGNSDGYLENVIAGNDQGTIGGFSTNLGGNLCEASASCP